MAPRQGRRTYLFSRVRIQLFGKNAGAQCIALDPVQVRAHLFKRLIVRGSCDSVLRVPEGRDEPRVARRTGGAPVVVVAGIARDTSDGCLNGKCLLGERHRANDPLVVGRQDGELKDAECARSVDRAIVDRESLRLRRKRTIETPVLGIVQMFHDGALHLLGDAVEIILALILSEYVGELGGRFESSVDRRGGVGMYAEFLFPKIVRGFRKSRIRVAMRGKKSSGGLDERSVHRLDEVDILGRLPVFPKRPKYERRLVFLNGKFRMSADKPSVPRRTERAVGTIFVHEISLRRKRRFDELEEFSRTMPVAEPVERHGNICPVARPNISISIAPALKHVGVSRSDDAAMLVDM